MRDQLKRLFSESVIYGISGIISSFINIFLIPLYTKVFNPSDYGVISLLLTTSALLGIFIIFSLDSSATVWFWDKPETDERKTTFTSWFCFLVAAGIISFILLSSLSTPLSRLYFGTSKYYLLFILLGINLCFSGFQKIVNIWCRMLQKPFWAMGYSLFLLLTTIGCNILFVLKLKVGVMGVFYSQAIASILGFLLLFVLFRSWLDFKKFNRDRLNEMIRFAAPLVPATIMFWLMNAASVFFLKYFTRNDAEVGLFQVGLSIGNVLALFTWGFFQAWSAFALSISKQENAKRVYSFVLELFCVLGFFVALSLFLGAKDILLVFTNEKYLGAKDIIGLFAINVILQGIPNILAIANYLAKSNKSYAVAIAIGSIISVAGFVTLIPLLGKEGAALAMVLGNLFVPIYLGVKAQKLYHVPYKFERILFFILFQALIFVAARYTMEGLWKHILVVFFVGTMMLLFYYRIAKKAGVLRKFRFAAQS